MKKLYPIFAICLALSLTACSDNSRTNGPANSGNDGSSAVSSDESSVSTSTTSTTSTISSDGTGTSDPAEVSEFLVGLAGDTIKAEDYLSDMSGVTPETLTTCLVDGTYIAMPEGIFRTSLSNPDVFDKENNCFTDVPYVRKKDFIRVKAGEEINGLKIKKAQSCFSRSIAGADIGMGDGTTKKATELGFPEIYFDYGELELEGTVEMTGYISMATKEESGIHVGDIWFYPTECKPALPIVCYQFDPNEGFFYDVGKTFREGDFSYTNEYNTGISLGNKDSVTADISKIPSDGSFVKATIVVKNISMKSSISNYLSRMSGELVSVE